MMTAGRRILGLVLAAMVTRAGAADPPGASGGVFDELIGPILRARCVECHGPDKQKAKLALHSWERLWQGSDAGPVIVPGQPGESTLVQRLKLPLDDEEHMPPTEHPQPAPEEVALIEHWIARGAARPARREDLGLPGPLLASLQQLPARLAALNRPAAPPEVLWSYDAAAVNRSRQPLADRVAKLQQRFPGALSYESRTATALHFTAAGLGRDFGDAELAELAALRDELVVLDLSRSGITDASAGILAGFSRLRVLRAAFTEVGDATVEALAALAKLESLTLHETRITPACVGPLSRMRSLRLLRLGGTSAEEPARAAKLPVPTVPPAVASAPRDPE